MEQKEFQAKRLSFLLEKRVHTLQLGLTHLQCVSSGLNWNRSISFPAPIHSYSIYLLNFFSFMSLNYLKCRKARGPSTFEIFLSWKTGYLPRISLQSPIEDSHEEELKNYVKGLFWLWIHGDSLSPCWSFFFLTYAQVVSETCCTLFGS